LVNTVIGYLLFMHKVSLINAHQRNDIIDGIATICRIMINFLQIFIVVWLKNMYLYVILTTIYIITYNFWCSYECDKRYPQYTCNGNLDKETSGKIKKEVSALALQKIGKTISNSLDSIVISAFLGLTVVAVYGNYNYVISAITTFTSLIYVAIQASIGNKVIDIDGLSGGVSFSIKDIDKIKSIIVNSDKVMTVENKTSFLRMNMGDCYVYLGGFATKSQIAFIKKLISDNPDKEYLHFGDIDAGGFWIHKKLCEQTNQHFDLFHMNENDLKNLNYSCCLKSLSENDIKRLNSLKTINEYSKCITYMIKFNKKLEQEIISYNLSSR